MIPRSYAPDAERIGAWIDLSDDEAAHLRRVLRVHDGNALCVFNGRGREFDAHLALADGDGVRAYLDAERRPAAEPRVHITLAAAVLKGDAMDAVVRDAAMLGVRAVQPVAADRSRMTAATMARGRRPDRWRRVAIASAKQCGRATVPDLLPVAEPGAVAAALRAGTLPAPAFLLVEPSASLESAPIGEVASAAPAFATVLIGPEGGWTADELQTLSPLARAITLGGLTLRAEAAPIVALSALLAVWDAF